VIAYYVRKLLLKGLKSMREMVFEHKARTYVMNICKQTYIHNSLRRCFDAFVKYRRLHHNHRLKNVVAAMRYRDSMIRKFIRIWHKTMIDSQSETNLLVAVRTKLLKSEKRRLFQGWHDTIVD